MVLEDDPLSVAMLRAVLEQLGHGVLHLADIKRAARKENHRMVVKRGIVAKDNRAAFAAQAARVAAE